MKLDDIKTGISFDEIWVRVVSGGPISLSDIGRLFTTDVKGLYRFFTGASYYTVELHDVALAMDLNFHLGRGCAHLAQIMLKTKDGKSFTLKAVFFNRRLIDMDTVEVGIDKRIEETAERHKRNFKNQEELASLLKNECEISDGKNTWFLIKTGAAKDDYLNDMPVIDNETQEEDKDDSEQIPVAFSICGEGFTIPVEKRRLDRDNEIFFATRIVYKKNQADTGPFTLVSGNLIFSGLQKRIQVVASNALRELDEQGGGYLAAWDHYGDEEGKALIEKAKAVGVLSYKEKPEREGTGFSFYINEPIPQALSENDELELIEVADIPPYLKNPKMTWEEYRTTLEFQYKDDENKKQKEARKQENENSDAEMSADSNNAQEKQDYANKSSYTIDDITDRYITLANIDLEPPLGMVLVLSILGDRVQFERQIRARIAIKEGRAANPQLGLIIEENGEPADTVRVPKIKPITTFVYEKIFGKHPPTERQKEAIDIALNTPDIALIQGPPGTGKTTVITAILERLNEEYDKKNSMQGKILVSGYQHDAVENITARLSVNSLPAVKFGIRHGENQDDETTTQKKIETWTEDITEKMKEKNPQLQPIEEQIKLEGLLGQYVISPSASASENILNLILSFPRKYISNDIVSAANRLLRSIKSEDVLENQFELTDTLASIRALRTTEDDFIDDGTRNALTVFVKLRDHLRPEESELLQKADKWKQGDSTDFLKKLEELKTSLLNRFTPPPVFSIEKPRKEILDLIANVNEELRKNRGRGNTKDEILASFLNELETNPEGVRAAIEDYNFVYAATTQGAEGGEIRKAKTKDKRENVIYDTVIIDEAARASPRDLLIPMAQAEKRIILVGDHRQLPHMIDDEIVRKAMESERPSSNTQTPDNGKKLSEQFEDYIKRSMFEYLKNRLEKLSAKDGIQRICTLDEQYRSHPLLGEFINKNFYEPHHGESFRSPLPASSFEQYLPGLDGKPALWINVPGTNGHFEENCKPSYRRREETTVIARQLKEWLDCEAGKNLTFGVISFYRAQSNAILEEAGKFGIADRDSATEPWAIKEEYKYLTRETDGKKMVEERLRIGTVDSFQGMEFDVVFLSVVRSRQIPRCDKQNASDYRRLQTKTFGHLVSENRLCVSMSRQKKVLVVVGDAALAQSEIGRDAVPALAAFCDLCKTEGKFRDS